jgi:hypothetical protein
VLGAGYEPTSEAVTVTAGGVTQDFKTRRDWAASSGGASIVAHTGPAYGGCGPAEAIDLNQATGWSTTSYGSGHAYTSRHIVIDLGRKVDVSAFAIDPSATCGDGASAATAKYKIETSSTSATSGFVTARTGTFDSADNGRMNSVTPTSGASGVRYVRVTLLGNQTPDYSHSCSNGGGAYSGCAYTDLTEFAVYGTATP